MIGSPELRDPRRRTSTGWREVRGDDAGAYVWLCFAMSRMIVAVDWLGRMKEVLV